MKKHTPIIEFSKVTFSFSDTRVLFDNLSFKNNRDRIPPDDTALKAQLENFLLSDLSPETNAQTLSVGQLQRLCLICGLMLDPPRSFFWMNPPVRWMKKAVGLLRKPPSAFVQSPV
jgi:ATPase subunit of ABC transporter with duplicated ATPase domains